MFRIWLCIIALLFASVGGSGSLPVASSGDVCTQSCPDDNEHGQCAPDCDDCLCCGHVRPVMIARSTAVLLSLSGAVLIEHEEQEPPSVETGDILHVPIVALA